MKTEITKKLTAHIIAECSAVDMEERFRDVLDECYSFKEVGGDFSNMMPSRVLAECDPVAFRCGLNDYADGERDTIAEIDGNHYERREVEKAKEAFIDRLRDELAEIEGNVEEANSVEIEELQHLQAEIEEAEDEEFAD